MRLASVLLVGMLVASARAEPPRGRVVRVERPRGLGIPRLCKLSSLTKGVCAGTAKPGDRIAVIDKALFAIVAEIRIDRVTPSNVWRCDAGPTSVEITGKIVSGGFDPADEVDAFRSVLVTRASRLVKNQALPPGGHGEILLALDADDNGETDVVLTKYACTERGALDARGPRQCFDTFRERGGRLELADQLIMCN